MHIYLDESGDVGFKFHQGSSTYFVIALLLVNDPIPLHQAIHDLRIQLALPEEYEFKFMSAGHTRRKAFFQAIKPYEFRVRCLVINKKRLYSSGFRKKGQLYSYFVKQILEHDFGSIQGAMLIIDESFKGKSKKEHFTTYLQRELNRQTKGTKIKDVRYHASHRDNLIQAVDMIAGAIARSYERSDKQYQGSLKGKLQDVWEFPR